VRSLELDVHRQGPAIGVEGDRLAVGERRPLADRRELETAVVLRRSPAEGDLADDANVALPCRAFRQDEDLLDAGTLALVALDQPGTLEVDDVRAASADRRRYRLEDAVSGRRLEAADAVSPCLGGGQGAIEPRRDGDARRAEKSAR
jgi:hypothetical protein